VVKSHKVAVLEEHRMRKKIIVFFLTGMLTVSTMLTGCGSTSSEKAQQYKELGVKQMSEASYEDAVESFQKALNQSKGRVGAEEVDICYYKALAQYKSGDIEGAIETYTALIDYYKKNWEAYYLRGSVYLKDGQNKKAISDYDQAVALNDDDFELYASIYENLEAAGCSDQGEKYLTAALEIKTSTAEDQAGLGYIYYLKKDYDNAQKYLNTAVSGGYDKAMLTLGKVYVSQGNMDEAKTAFDGYIEKYPQDADALNQLGEICLNAGENEQAVKYLEQALDLNDDTVMQSVERNLVSAYERTGDFDGALQMAALYLEAVPNDETMQKEYEFLQTRIDTTAEESDTEDESQDTTDDATQDQTDDTTDDTSQNTTDDTSQDEGGTQ
jgi:tetratricopeptide (TPR) repeat protein